MPVSEIARLKSLGFLVDENRRASATDLRRLDAANVRKSRRHPQPRDMKDPFVVVDIDRFDYPPPNERPASFGGKLLWFDF